MSRKLVSQKLGMLIVLAMLSLPLAGCITIGKSFSMRPISLVEKGKTSQKEVLALFGNPVRTGKEDGNTTWTYLYYKANVFGSFEGRDMVVKFDDQGRVLSVTYNTTERSGGE